MKQRISQQVILALLLLISGGAAWAQSPFNPSNPPDPYMKYKVVAVANDGNHTSGSGSYTAGTEVTINTSAASDVYTFRYWKKNGVQFTERRQFTYTVEPENVRFEAVYDFTPANPADPQTIDKRRLYLVPDPAGAGSFNRNSGDKFDAGSNILLTAYPNQGFEFEGWYEGEMQLATTSSFYFTMPSANVTLTARFTYNPTSPGDPESSMTDDDWLLKGDIDGDGELSVTDVVLMVNAVMDSSGISNISKYDMDGDGEITVTDVVMLVSLEMNN